MSRISAAWRALWVGDEQRALPEGPQSASISAQPDRQLAPKRGTGALLELYSTSPWLRAAVGRVSQSMAAVPWCLFRATGRDRRRIQLQLARSHGFERHLLREKLVQTGQLQEIGDHELLQFLDKGNLHHTGVVSRRLTQIYMDLQGECFWIIERNGNGRPVEFLPVPGTWVTVPSRNEEHFKVQMSGRQIQVPIDDMLWIRDPDPRNPYGRGSGIAMALGDELDSDEYAAKMLKTRFFNHNIPAGIVSLEGASPTNVEAFKNSLDADHRGAWKWGRLKVINRKLTFNKIDEDLKQTQFVEIREFERNAIIQVFGVPPEIIGIIENSNRATIDSADLIFSRYVLVPRLDLLRDFLQSKLLPQFTGTSNLILDYENPVQEDREFQLKTASNAPWALSINEWREMMGLDPIPQGETHMIPLNMYPAGTADEQPQMPLNPETLENSLPTPHLRVITPPQAKATPTDVDAIMSRFRPVVMQAEMVDDYTAIVEESHVRTNEMMGVGSRFDLQNPVVHEHIREFGTERMTDKVAQTTKNLIRDELLDGVKAGEDIRQLTRRVRNVFSDADRRRAETIARTEVQRGANFGRWEAMRSSGVIEEKMWLSVMDGAQRDLHAALHRQVQPMNFPFNIEQYAAQYPGGFGVGEMDINCRCVMIPIVKGDTLSLTGQPAAIEKVVTDDQIREIFQQFDRDVARWEARLAEAARRAFKIQEEDILRGIQEVLG